MSFVDLFGEWSIFMSIAAEFCFKLSFMSFVDLFGEWSIFKSIAAEPVNLDLSVCFLANYVFLDGFSRNRLNGFKIR